MNPILSPTSPPPDAAQALSYTNHPSEPGLAAAEVICALSNIYGVQGVFAWVLG